MSIDGVIKGGIGWRWEVCINISNYGIVIVWLDEVPCRLKDMSFDYYD